ncbi:oligopeptide/dipeptide ABC transporter ATP-binding protein [Microterricola viridarii]|uniref:Peptide ABC transporter ATP-binding protein n=1 Tax=Microterricola viridarii TaxID=412690 RepID=A0A0Y0MT63_9MICO|nr:oligopeptide/dipeptide ABC transporter ATP-binding protein [Microterricola viridarii]AMB57607.1 peptide ABC transporter ATP-binding protein [Microterricola viridarii]
MTLLTPQTSPTDAAERPVLEVENLVIRYGRPSRRPSGAPAVDGVSFSIAPGETLGLVGESGSGKTTIGKAILGLQPVTSGTIRFEGEQINGLKPRGRRVLSSRLRAVFQDPYSSLNPRLSIGDSLSEPLLVSGVRRDEARARAEEMLEQVGLPRDAVNRMPRQFSGGQRQRIAVARALITRPSLVVCDEPVSALDLSTQAQVLNLLADLRDDLGLSYLFIAHDMAVVRMLAQRVIVLYRGQVMEEGQTTAVMGQPQHPFTQALLAASPVPNPIEQAERRRLRESRLVSGSSAASASHTGCPFAARCPMATELCRTERPALRLTPVSQAACHYV